MARADDPPNMVLSKLIVAQLRLKQVFKRDAGVKLMYKLIFDIIESYVAEQKADSIDTDSLALYTKADFKKTLLTQFEAGKIEAGKLLADINQYKSNSDDFVVIPMHWSDVPNADADKLMYNHKIENDKVTH